MKAGKVEFDAPEWQDVSGQAKELVQRLMAPDPEKRLTAPELLIHPWIVGTDVPTQPLPATHERLQALARVRVGVKGLAC